MSPLPENKTTDAPAEFRRHALKDFWGDVEDINAKGGVTQSTQKPYTDIVFDMKNIEIIESFEPWPHPTTQVSIRELDMPNTEWAAWKESIRKCGYSGPLNGLITKRLHWVWTSGVLLSQRKLQMDDAGNVVRDENGRTVYAEGYENRPGTCWQVVEIVGVENTGDKLIDWSIEHADGKTLTEFKTEFMADAEIRAYTNYGQVVVAVSSDQWLNTLVAGGQLTIDGSGVYHKVG